MARVTLVQMIYNGLKFIPQSVESMLNQTYKDIEVVVIIDGNEDGGKEYIEQHFPRVRIIDRPERLRFVRGHNLLFNEIDTEFFQLVNQDLILEPDYVEKMLTAFENPEVAGANGKIYQYNFDTKTPSKVLDTTGIMMYRTGRARSRGQNQEDIGQYDSQLELIGVDGAACMYRGSALEAVKYQRYDGSYEYFDVDFEMYWEDADLSLRFINAGFHCRYVPSAVGYHGRTASSSKEGYRKVRAFVSHHTAIPLWIREFNFRNHIYLYVKNVPKFYWKFFAREFFMMGYIVVFEIKVLKTLPTFFRLLPRIWQKRKYIQSGRKISIADFEKLFAKHPTDL